MIFVTLVVILLITLVFLGVTKHRRTVKMIEHIPGPYPLPFIGNLLDLGRNTEELLENFHRLTKKYGRVVRIFVGSKLWVFLTDPKHIGQVLTTTESNYKGDLYKIALPLIGEGLVLSSGEKWVRHRRIFNTMFSNKKLGNYVGVFNSAANILVDQLKQLSQQEYVDVTDPIFTYTLYSLCKTVMRIDLTENTKYHEKVTELTNLMFNRFTSPIKMFNLSYYFTSDYRKLRKCAKYVDDFVESVIKKRKQELNTIAEESTSLLDEMFKLTGEDELSENEIRDHVKTFVFAGSDTVGITLSFTLYELAKCPGIQDKILEEIESVLSSDLKGDINFEDLHQLKYTECVLKEALRLHPPPVFISRTLSSDMNFDGLRVPADTAAIIFIYGLHKLEQFYPNPEKFDPDRFLPENCTNLPPYAYIPFSAGARVCIGQKFAMLEAKLTLAKIVRNFEITQHPGHVPRLAATGTLKSMNGLPVKLKLRKCSTK